MKYTNRGNKFGDRKPGGKKFVGGPRPRKGGFGDRPGFGGGESFEATCAKCGKTCRVPFRPNGSKPVLCTNCYRREGGAGPKRMDRPSFGGTPFKKFGDRPQPAAAAGNVEARLSAIERKLDAIIKAMAIDEDEE